eukprot:TRINITY_DN4171_c0_g1_i1.p1 TRINITY_DN4171_c0_g1~~TRINITY_DN4171_c0_g1_i1.p1  ORF type:complete len:2196 (-),score=786.80 TRINITY_DN4171_c0_g1_i1:32-6574(-)
MASPIFGGFSFAVTDTSSRPTTEIIKLIKQYGGSASYMLNKKTTHLVTTAEQVANKSIKVKTALEYGAKVLSDKYILDCIAENQLVDDSKYLLTAKESFDQKPKDFFNYQKEFITEAEMLVKQEELKKAEEERKKKEEIEQKRSQARLAALATPDPHAISFGSTPSSVITAPQHQDVDPNRVIPNQRKPRPTVLGQFEKAKVWRTDDKNQPAFPVEYDLIYYDTLQWTDVQSNHNKYYCLEYHIGKIDGKEKYRLYTHYGRTDDLITKGNNSGRRECRYYDSNDKAENGYAALIEEKTLTKGYRRVDLLISNIGSEKLRAWSQQSKAAALNNTNAAAAAKAPVENLPRVPPTQAIKDLTRYIYEEATNALTSTLGKITITANGIETPLGVLNAPQIDKAEALLKELYQLFTLGQSQASTKAKIEKLSNDFYTMIPHNIGRQRDKIQQAVINSIYLIEEKQELLQLMKDMLQVAAENPSDNASDLDMKYFALKCKVDELKKGTGDYIRIENQIQSTCIKGEPIIVDNIFAISRPAEKAAFKSEVMDQRLLFHGSRISNYVGLLSRGVLMPKVVVAMGGKRRDAGLLGNGIYFGDTSSTSAAYTTAGAKGTRMMLMCKVALGNVKHYNKVTFGLTEPPAGYNSVHGVRSTPSQPTDFVDDEYVIFNTNQQHQEYLVEFRFQGETLTPLAHKEEVRAMNPAAPVPKINDALAFMENLKKRFHDKPFVVKEFMEIMSGFKSGIMDTNVVVSRAKELFGAEPDLMRDFAHFLPPGALVVEEPKPFAVTEEDLLGMNDQKTEASGDRSSLTTLATISEPSADSGTMGSSKLKGIGLRKSFKSGPTSTLLASIKFDSPLQLKPTAKLFGLEKKEPQVIDEADINPQDVAKALAGKSEIKSSLLSTKTDLENMRLQSGINKRKHSVFSEHHNKAKLKELQEEQEHLAKSFQPRKRHEHPMKISSDMISHSASTILGGSTSSVGAPGSTLNNLTTSFGFNKAPAWRKTVKMAESTIGAENLKIKRQEDKLREVFAQDKKNYKTADPYVHLIDVFNKRESFYYQQETKEELALSKLFNKIRTPSSQDYAIVTKEEFKKGFKEICHGVFKGLDWSNVFVAGGAVLGSLMNITDRSGFKDSDIDMFLYGLTEEEANDKLKHIYFIVQSNTKATCEVIRTKNAVTILGQYPYRHIQIVLRLYKSPAEILMGFDIDACTVGFDGDKVWGLPRAQRALTKRYNLVDMSRRSLTYEARLYKYAKRGFAVAVPGLDRQLVRADLYQKKPHEVKGLAKLILFEHEATGDVPAFIAWKPKAQRFQAYSKDEFTANRINEFETIEQLKKIKPTTPIAPTMPGSAVTVVTVPQEPQPEKQVGDKDPDSDYSTLYVPWGPQWYTQQILKHLEFRDKRQFFATIHEQKAKPKHILFSGIEGVIAGRAAWDKFNNEQQQQTGATTEQKNEYIDAHVEGPLKWLTENPGRQLLTGSFHPIDDDNWYNEAYGAFNDLENELLQAVCDACFSGRSEIISILLRKARKLDLNKVDPHTGRNALMHACSQGHLDAFRQIIDKDVDANILDAKTGFRPVHFAAFKGSALMTEILLRKNVDVNIKTEHQGFTALHIAAYYGNADVVRVLVDQTQIDLAVTDNKGRSIMQLAAMGGNNRVLEILLKAKAPLIIADEKGITPIKAAAERGHLRAVEMLEHALKLQAITDLNGIPIVENTTMVPDKEVELLQVTSTGNVPKIEQVLEKPNVVQKDKFGVTPLHMCAHRSFAASLVELFRKKGVVLNAKDKYGQTALHYAARYASVQTVKALLAINEELAEEARNASSFAKEKPRIFVELEAQNMFGHTPLYVAMFQLAKCHSFKDNYDELSGLPLVQEKHDWEEIAQLLKKAGARAPALSFYYSLAGELPSPYLSNGKVVKLNKTTTPRETLRSALNLGPYVPEVEEEFVPSYLKGKTQAKKPVFEEEDDFVAMQPPRKKKFEWSEPVSASLPRSPLRTDTPTFNFPIPQENPFTVAVAEKKSTDVKRSPMKHSPFKNAEREGPSSPVMARRVLDTQPGFSFGETNHFASSASEPLPAFSLSQQPGQQGGSSLFVSEPVPVAEKPASTQGLAALKARVLSLIKPNDKPKTAAGKVLLGLSKLHKKSSLSADEKSRLKTLALQDDKKVVSAFQAFDADKDETELLDTLKMIITRA